MNVKSLLQASLAVAVVAAMSLPLAAQAQGYQTIDVIGGHQAGSTINVSSDQDLLFNVRNTSNGPVTFSIPSLALTYTVPAGQDRTVFVDMQNVTTRDLVYTVTDASGNQVATGTIINNDFVGGTTASSLSSIINYSTEYTAVTEPEPTYEQPVAMPTQTEVREQPMIRGYW